MNGLLKLKLQVLCGDEVALGPGKAELLDAIEAAGSISGAARALGMSYRRAWQLVDTMNRCWHEPLVETAPGVTHGGGARLTPAGQTVLAHYRKLEAALQDTAQGAGPTRALADLVRAEPRLCQRD